MCQCNLKAQRHIKLQTAKHQYCMQLMRSLTMQMANRTYLLSSSGSTKRRGDADASFQNASLYLCCLKMCVCVVYVCVCVLFMCTSENEGSFCLSSINTTLMYAQQSNSSKHSLVQRHVLCSSQQLLPSFVLHQWDQFLTDDFVDDLRSHGIPLSRNEALVGCKCLCVCVCVCFNYNVPQNACL